ncbi:MAG: AAA family ATPase, partial [Rhodospirillales bacterium]|nr:AAA family ATPase [Rhodospirillales bacterium]
DLLVLAGRPGMGKTALATKIAFGAAKALAEEARAAGSDVAPRATVAIFSLEMSAEQLATRLLSEEARISGDRIRRGDIGQKEFDNFVRVSGEISGLPLQIDDTPAITLSAMRTRCRRLKRTKGLALIVVDYLQLMRPSAGTRPENRVLEISQITQGLKAIAKELAVPVLALSQLSRAVESREDKRPQLSDLRESGTIEQDADAVMFIYRDEYYLAQKMPKEMAFDNGDKFQGAIDKWQQDMDRSHNKAELIIAKQRHGPTGKIDLFFEAEFTRFADLDQTHDGYD